MGSLNIGLPILINSVILLFLNTQILLYDDLSQT